MRQRIFITAALMLAAGAAMAQEVVTGVGVNSMKIERNGNYMAVDMTLDVSALKVKRNRAVLLTPCVINPDDSVHLKSIGVYGRKRYFYYLRNYGEEMISGKDEMTYRAKKLTDEISYSDLVPYERWMNGSTLQLHRYLYGCCEEILAMETGRLGGYADFVPEFLYVTPKAEVKTRSVEGSAYIDFPVDQTTIHPDYRRNPAELAKINATIDSVRSDRDITINTIWLKGYASPESPYSHNTELAIGRVNAIKTYIQGLYHFTEEKITTEYEPEDWGNLRRYVEQSDLEHRTEILALIDSNMEPDAKEWKIKSTYPAEYKFLLENCYPALRHTDYRVNYTVRGYSNIEEINEILHTQPQKLSLNEMYLLAQTLEPGSEEYIEVFEVAVRMYPDDEIANLNAANVEMKHGEYAAAERYLSKAGDSAEAEYARGIYHYLNDDYAAAREHLTDASQRGITQADTLLENIAKVQPN